MKKNILIFKRMMVFCLVMALIANCNIYAIAANTSSEIVQPEMDLSGLEDNTSVTYNLETNEITYGADQNANSTMESTIEDDGGISPNYIIGDDNRKLVTNTLDSPYRNVCQLTVKFSDGSIAVGSGTLVYNDVLLTAGHVVYNQQKGWATSIDVAPGRYGRDVRLGKTWATSMTTSNNWINNADYNYDWAIVDLKTSFSTWQQHACYQDANVAVNRTVQAIGYPSDPGNNNYNYYMYEDKNIITSATSLTCDGIYDMTPGQSGGAVIDVATGYLVGIISVQVTNTSGTYYANRAVLVTPDLSQRIKAHQD
ncbi:MAG: trypsin-like serine protease [Clostridia bacterium]|nr:trypsin-like serine protease [Clostridia bacterium]